jgi:DNA-binding SARP family transcriptional activator
VTQETIRGARLRLRTFGGLSVVAESGEPLPDAVSLRRPLILLALLAVAGQRGMSRDKLSSFISPESDAERSRNTLKQTVFRLRRALQEPDLILGTNELRLNPEVLSSDVGEFVESVKAGNRNLAAELYVGSFLDGVHLRDAPEFCRWLEVERDRLKELAEQVLRESALQATSDARHLEASTWWRRLAELRPAEGTVAVGLMRSLDAIGERDKALEHARNHAAYVRSQLDAEPDSRVLRFADELRTAQTLITSPAPSSTIRRSVKQEITDEAEETPEVRVDDEIANVDRNANTPRRPFPKRLLGRRAVWPTIGLLIAVLILALPKLLHRNGDDRPAAAPPVDGIDGLSSSSDATCAVIQARIWCWGRNDEGQLGNGTARDATIPTTVPALGDPPHLEFTEVTTHSLHSCALSSAGLAYCWGQNNEGQLGVPSLAGSALPVQVSGGVRFRALSAGTFHTCGLALNNSIFCWGWNNYGQLGNPAVQDVASSPVRVAGALTFSVVTANYLHTCALTLDGFAYCWGSNVEGQLGIGGGKVSRVPALVTDARTFAQIVTGSNHTCAVDVAGEAFCWGYNAFGQLGLVTTAKCGRVPYQVPCSPRPLPVRTKLRFTKLGAGKFHTCGLDVTGEAYCWGKNDQGQLGDGSFSHSYVPVPVAGGLRFVLLVGGPNHTCGVATGARVYCWGANDHGQLGDGSRAPSAAPIEVRLTR